MYRVELKVLYHLKPFHQLLIVPNVPCGVESPYYPMEPIHGNMFLMYRVELKDEIASKIAPPHFPVPNVPCGVESTSGFSLAIAKNRS